MIELKLILGTLLIIEAVTLLARFGLNKESRNIHVHRMKRKWKKRTIHWHHFLIGLAIIPLAFFFSNFSEQFLFNLGIGIFFSDIVHHFIFLAFITGSPEFCLVYKNKDYPSLDKPLTRRRRILKKFVKEV